MLFKFVLALCMLTLTMGHRGQLQSQIDNTKRLINLYQQKLALLEQQWQQHYANTTEESFELALESEEDIQLKDILEGELVICLDSDYDEKAVFLPTKFIVSNRKIYDLQSKKVHSQFVGEFLLAANNEITTLIGSKITVLELTAEGFQSDMTGISGRPGLKSHWHKTASSQGEDLFIQIDHNKLIFKGKSQSMELNFSSEVLNIYSLNQYKLFYLTRHEYGIIKVRTYENAQRIPISNSSSETSDSSSSSFSSSSSEVFAVCSWKQQSVILILLSNGTLQRYLNQKVIENIQVPLAMEKYDPSSGGMTYIFPYLFIHSTQMHYFSIYNITSHSKIEFWMDAAPQGTIHQKAEEGTTYQYQFFKFNHTFLFLHGKNGSKKSLYELLIPTQPESQHSTLSWKLMLIAIVVVCVILFKTKLTGKGAEEEQPQRRPKGKKKNSQKNTGSTQEIEAYLKKLSDQKIKTQ